LGGDDFRKANRTVPLLVLTHNYQVNINAFMQKDAVIQPIVFLKLALFRFLALSKPPPEK
jgi:hypothetical protein